MANVLSDEVISGVATVVYPVPRHGEGDPPEDYDEVIQRIARRLDYAAHLHEQAESTGADPLLVALSAAAADRDAAEDLVRRLIAYGRHCTGRRPDYTWERLAEAAGLPYSTARRVVTQDDVDRVRADLDPPGVRWPAAAGYLDVHRARAALDGFALAADLPADLDHDAEYRWWITQAERKGGRLGEQIRAAADTWHTMWLNAIHPRAQHYRRMGEQLRDLATILHHDDPEQRFVADERAQLTALREELDDLLAQLPHPSTDTDRKA